MTKDIFNHSFRYFKIFIVMIIAISSYLEMQASYPLVRNFSRSLYNAGTQNWAAAQDSLGRMYFGNDKGLLSFDSKSWEQHYNSNHTTVRSINIDNRNGRIYVGGSSEFGYFQNNNINGDLDYYSLIPTLKDDNIHLTEIWNIFKKDNDYWFQSDYDLLCYDGNVTSTIHFDDKITTSALIDNKIYVASINKGINMLSGNKFIPINGNEFIIGKKVVAILNSFLPFDQLLIVTSLDGVYSYNGNSIKPLKLDIDPFLRENQVFTATISNNNLIFGTVNLGIVIKDCHTNESTFLNTLSGMQNNTVLNIYIDKLKNIWLGLDNGIDYVLHNSPISNVLGNPTIYGAGYASLLIDKTLFMGTNHGLYSTVYPLESNKKPTEMESIIKGQVWSIDTIGKSLFACCDAGLYQNLNGQWSQIKSIPGTWSVTKLKKHPGYALAFTYNSFYLIQNKNGVWSLANKINGFNEAGSNVIEDKWGNIWIGHWMKGVYKLILNENLSEFTIDKLFNKATGLPADYNNIPNIVNNEFIISSPGGFFKYVAESDSFISDAKLDNLFKNNPSAKIYQPTNNDIWNISYNLLQVAYRNNRGGYDVDSLSFKPLSNKIIAGFNDLNFINDQSIIISNQDGFYEIKLKDNKEYVKEKHNIIIKIFSTVENDSLIFNTTKEKYDTCINIPYKHNSLRFIYTMPEYRAENAVLYSCLLEKYDEEWSSLSRINTKEYTRLAEGNYILRIKAIDTYDGENIEYSLKITILPPWYRSIWAYCVYFIMFIILLVFTIKYIKKSYQDATRAILQRKEKELEEIKHKAEEETIRKNYEIAHLKNEQLEHDIKSKSEELSNITMNMIRKNEILMDISAMISKLQESENDGSLSISANKQLNKIQNITKESISHDDDWRNFIRNFDIVYENYMNRLLEQYPQLNLGDQRLCAYLKMGLCSKDIAPLMNISFRSVEMARYRLRKKMELSRDTNLAEYLQKL